MGADRASYAGGQAFGSAARHRVARRGGRDLVYRADRLSVADIAEGTSSLHDGAKVFLPFARERPVFGDLFLVFCADAGRRRDRSEALFPEGPKLLGANPPVRGEAQ